MFAQLLGQVSIQFDGVHGGTLTAQQFCQKSQTGTYFYDVIALLYIDSFDDFSKQFQIDKEILTKRSVRPDLLRLSKQQIAG